MSLDDLNREQKRSLKKMGALDEQGRPTRAPAPQARQRKERTTPALYLREVRDEMRKTLADPAANLDARNLLARACPRRGRLRDLVRRSLRNYALNVLRDGQGIAREIESHEEPDTRMETAQEVFAKAWGRRVIERAYETIDEDYRQKNRTALCEALKPHLNRWSGPPGQVEVAHRLGLSPTHLSTELTRLRQRFRHVMLHLLSEEGGSPQEAGRRPWRIGVNPLRSARRERPAPRARSHRTPAAGPLRRARA